MYICSCNAVTDGQIRRCVFEEGVATWKELMRKTKVGTQCGICAKYAFALFKQLKAEKDQVDLAKTAENAPEQPTCAQATNCASCKFSATCGVPTDADHKLVSDQP